MSQLNRLILPMQFVLIFVFVFFLLRYVEPSYPQIGRSGREEATS